MWHAVIVTIWIALTLVPGEARAQWLNQPVPGIPRTRDGKPDLKARAPRSHDGKPDFSGVWQIDDPTREERYKFFFDGINNLGEDVPSKYFMNVLDDFNAEDTPLRPEFEPLLRQRMAGRAKDIPSTKCLPFGLPMIDYAPFPFKILQMPRLVTILYERDTNFRQIFMDGRMLPQDPVPTWLGYSVGRWQGDTLVVESNGLTERSWLDAFGHPHSESMRVTERFHRLDFGHMTIDLTVDDSKTYTRPFTIKLNMHLLPDTDLLESFCEENERDLKHIDAK